MWLLLAFGNMVTLTALRLIQKPFVDKTNMNAFRVNGLTQLVSLPVLLAVIVFQFQQIRLLSFSFWLVSIAVVAGFYPAVNYLYFKTIKEHDLSVVLPLLGLLPIMTLLAAWPLLGQTPSLLSLVGCTLISAAIYVLDFRNGMRFYEPFQNIFHSSSARAMFIISIITAIATIGDKFAIDRSGTQIYSVLNMLGALIVLAICDGVLTMRQKDLPRPSSLTNKESIITITLMGILLFTTQYLGFAVLKAAPYAGYAIAIRNLNIVFASLLALAALHERVTRHKLISYGLSSVGVVLIAL